MVPCATAVKKGLPVDSTGARCSNFRHRDSIDSYPRRLYFCLLTLILSSIFVSALNLAPSFVAQ
jgi:hypothetical protein